jgi:hypothetical protein
MRRSQARIGGMPRCEPLRSRTRLVKSAGDRTLRPVNAGCTPGLSKQPNAASPERRGCSVFPDEPGVQPRVEWGAGAMNPARDKSCARAQRFASCRHADGCFRAPLLASSRQSAVQGLFFGDFLLAPQKKVTRPPGRTPGNATGTRTSAEATSKTIKPPAPHAHAWCTGSRSLPSSPPRNAHPPPTPPARAAAGCRPRGSRRWWPPGRWSS